MTPELNYFTCTLGQAAQWKRNVPEDEQSFQSVLDLVDVQARVAPHQPALAFADFTRDDPISLTFKQLRDFSVQAIDVLLEALGRQEQTSPPETIGLICSSGLDFVLTWLGLMRLGHTVFLLAPQLDHRGLKYLCSTTNASIVFVDDEHLAAFKEVGDDVISVLKVPSFSSKVDETRTSHSASSQKDTARHGHADTAYLRHTSGTSSGLPKPIVQSQWGAVGVLPRLPLPKNPVATFSTTPLYHGGLADCFRAWSCGSPIWFFPEGKAPVTCANILRAIKFAREKSSSSKERDNVRYFSSVPYVLQMLSDEGEGIEMLRTMDLVGVGGAALPIVIGNRLVESGVRLVSRMGSAECGFLLSSDRDYDKDKEWQYLRCAVDDPDILCFEPQDGSDLCELVAKPKWPLRNKTNRDDGSFATSDLFERHHSIQNAWRYHSRSDAQITLANGKKFDPAPLEDAIRASLSKILQDVLVFGAGRDYPGALLFSKPPQRETDNVLSAAWPAIAELNKNSSSQARLSRSALVCVIPQDSGDGAKAPLEKSSKGTVLRKQAEERYKELIESAYSNASLTSRRGNVSDEALPSALADEFQNVLGRPLDMDEDLFQQGVDSIACIQLRKVIESAFLPGNDRAQRLPLNVIYDCGSISALASHIVKLRSGNAVTSSGPHDEKESELNLMESLADKYSGRNGQETTRHSTNDEDRKANGHSRDIVVLTGATGLLGAHVVDILANNPRVDKIYCLVRGQDRLAAEERVRKALSFRRLQAWEGAQPKSSSGSKIICLPADLTDSQLGLSDEDLSTIRSKVTVVVHGAWTVNFSLRLRSFEKQIAGTRNLFDLAACAGSKFCFISSTAAVGGMRGSERISERPSLNARDASLLGYGQSKWVAERVCARLAESSSAKPVSTMILRIGQLCGNSHTGIWNASEAYPLMLSTASITKSLPRLPDQGLNWLPVDQAAAAITEIVLSTANNVSSPSTVSMNLAKSSHAVSIYHVLNPQMRPTWDEMLQWLAEDDTGAAFEAVSPREWLGKLQNVLSADSGGDDAIQPHGKQHPSASLLAFWQDKYGNEKASEQQSSVDETIAGSYVTGDAVSGGSGKIANGGMTQHMSRFDISQSQSVSRTMAEVEPLTKSQIIAMWRWIQENVGNKAE